MKLTHQQLNTLHQLGSNGLKFGHSTRTLNSLKRLGLIVKADSNGYWITGEGVRVIIEDEDKREAAQ